MSNTTNLRRTVFIKKAFQGRFILNVFLVVLLSGLCSAIVIYGLTGGALEAQSQQAHGNVSSALDNLGMSILIGNVVALLIAGTITVFMVLYASHKIAGPLYRFEKLCEHIGEGQLDTITSLREGDQLQDLGTAFGGMVEKLRTRKAKHQELVAQLAGHLENLQQNSAISSSHSEQLEQMQTVLKQLQE